jgi:3',5'-cyclic AMP phosphodiesterase CpdA
LRIWAIGDTGTARRAQYMVYEAMLNYSRAENKPIDFWLHMGDIAYWNGRDLEFQTRYFKVYAPSLRHQVMWPTYSNHDSYSANSRAGQGPYFDAFINPKNAEAGGVPSRHEAFYSFDVGRVHFISLDSMEFRHRDRPRQLNWLQADLKYATNRTDWIIAYFHHSPYTKGNHNSDREQELIEMRAVYMPVLEAGGVDVVLNGHSHIYERSLLMDGAYSTNTVSDNCIRDDGDGNPFGDGPYRKSPGINPREGTVVVVLGNGGIKMTRQAVMPVMAVTHLQYGSVILEIDGDTLTGTALNNYGDKIDLWQIVKKEKVTLDRLPAPWQSPDWAKLSWHTDEELNILAPVQARVLIPPDADWQYLAGGKNPQGKAWTRLDFEAKGWKTGPAPFGTKHEHVRTKLDDMQNKYTTIYARKEFEVDNIDRFTQVGLMIDYDDGFVAYLNGREVARRSVSRGAGAYAQAVKSHPAAGHEFVELRDLMRNLKCGKNVLAIEGHNSKSDSPFLLNPYLVAEE